MAAQDLTYRTITKEPLVAVMASDHRLVSQDAISAQELTGETFIGVSSTAPVLRAVINEYFEQSGLDITPAHEADNLAAGMALIASTHGIGLLPAYARNFLPWSVVSRPLEGVPPTIDLVLGYSNAKTSPILKLFLS